MHRKRWIVGAAMLVVALGVWIWITIGEESNLTLSSSEFDYELTVNMDEQGIAISPELYGAFFEEINHAGDGGLYAELIANRSFEDNVKSVDYWSLEKKGKSKAKMELVNEGLLNEIQNNALAVTVESLDSGSSMELVNHGFWGINVKQGAEYQVSFYAKRDSVYQGPLSIKLVNTADSKVIDEVETAELSSEWKRFTYTLQGNTDADKAKFIIALTHPGTVVLDIVSLFPETWKGRDNGLRVDLATLVSNMSPKFLRFPGGCFVEGADLDNAFKWKTTIGDISMRPGHYNLWGYEVTDGLGYHEFLQWAEDLGAKPLYVVNVGIAHSLGFAELGIVPLNELEPWILDVLDAIEYANGPVTSKWGAVRANNGHPEPFHLKYIEIGNENNFQLTQYLQRYPLFYNRIKEKYPDIELIANADVPGSPVEYIDEHYYHTAEWFMDHSTQYDSYDRNGPRIYVGEYAVTKEAGYGNMWAALGEAAFMTGMERNSDIVRMASYAPLFVHINDRRWNPDAIVFNHAASYGTPSYYVQSLFANHMGDVNVPTTAKVRAEGLRSEPISGGIGLGTWATQVEYDDVNVTSGGKELLNDDFSGVSEGWSTEGGQWQTADGVYKQLGSGENVRATKGSADWNKYTLTLRARKISGAEGMLVLFGVEGESDYYWWNIGGWGNSQSAIERTQKDERTTLGASVPLSISSNQWYDIKIEVDDRTIRCYLDGKLIHEISDPMNRGPLFYVSNLDTQTGEVIVKAVNVSDTTLRSQIQLRGATPAKLEVEAVVLSSNNPSDQNSLAQPDYISPKSSTIEISGASFAYEFPKYSVTVLRIPTKQQAGGDGS